MRPIDADRLKAEIAEKRMRTALSEFAMKS